jgi:uncharacterized protein (TIRG00374 family)
MNKKHLNLIIGLIIIVLFSYIAFRNVSLHDLRTALQSVKYLYLIPAVALVALTFLFRAMRWRYLVRSIKDVKTTHLFSPMMIGFMGNVLPARAGEFIRAYMLGKKENLSFSASFATIVVERLLDLLLFLVLLVGVLLFSADTLAQGSASGNHNLVNIMKSFGWSSFVLAIGLVVFLFLLQYKNDLAMKILAFFLRPIPEKWAGKITGMVASFTDGLSILKDRNAFLLSVVLSLLVWAAMVLTYYPIIFAFGIESELPVMTAVFIVSLTIGIFISLFPTPAFMGSFHLACVVALHEIFGISEAVAASYGIIAWLVAMGFIISAGMFFIFKDNISFSELSSRGEQQSS